MGFQRIVLLEKKSSVGEHGSVVALAHSVRVFADWSSGVTKGEVAVSFAYGVEGRPVHAGTMEPDAGSGNSILITGPIGRVDAEIIEAVVGGFVTVIVLLETNVG